MSWSEADEVNVAKPLCVALLVLLCVTCIRHVYVVLPACVHALVNMS